jgi:hypothetical protein
MDQGTLQFFAGAGGVASVWVAARLAFSAWRWVRSAMTTGPTRFQDQLDELREAIDELRRQNEIGATSSLPMIEHDPAKGEL